MCTFCEFLIFECKLQVLGTKGSDGGEMKDSDLFLFDIWHEYMDDVMEEVEDIEMVNKDKQGTRE